jgi:alkanesulfonate monooxygenase SsuD/methylene tetrahydromethanopterin reductase-like flavin-dependent oxidoreductase (luciferase family)
MEGQRGMGFGFGIFDSLDLGDSSPGRVLAERLEFAVAAEAAGIGHYHVTEHHGTPLSVCPSPNLFLAALSQRTFTLRFGPLVYVLPAYEPLRLAEEIATLDQLSGGRLDIGVGRGISPYELGFFGVAADRARPIYAETLAAVTGALATGRMRHRGEYLRDYDVELSVRPIQRPHPPLWYASSGADSARWAGAHGVHFVGRWNGGAFVSAADDYWEAWRARGSDGEAPNVGVAATVYIADTDEAALARYRMANEVFGRRLTKLWHEHGDHRADALVDPDSGLARGNALVGSARTVRDLLVRQVEAAAINYFEAMLVFGDLTRAEAQANLRAFAETVMPAVREAAQRRGRVGPG